MKLWFLARGLALAAAILTLCPAYASARDDDDRNFRKPLVIGHRGAHGYLPAHTLEGYALGGGCELALTCDMIIAGRSTKLGQPEIRVGIMPGAGGTQHLLRTIGKYRASKIVLTGEPVAAPDALAMGLLSEMVEDGRALSRALELAKTIAAMPPLAVRAIKEVLQKGADASLETALAAGFAGCRSRRSSAWRRSSSMVAKSRCSAARRPTST